VITENGQVRGSELIGQPFSDPRYFWGRLSATAPYAYNAGASSGSNYGPLNEDGQQAVQDRIAALKQADPQNTAPIPVDLVTASGSGLDPHISPAAAAYQVARVARARGLSEDQIRQRVQHYTQDRTFGLLGEPRVNVLQLNVALDELAR
jgi:K+-transporting ATPase ATPase C chain